MRYISLLFLTFLGCTEIQEDGAVRLGTKDKLPCRIEVVEEKDKLGTPINSNVKLSFHWGSED